MEAAGQIIQRVVSVIINPAILLIFTAGFLLFLWGLVVFIFKIKDGGDYSEGKQHMIWGIVGMLVMISVYGILNLIDNTFNLNSTRPDASRMQNVLPVADFGARN